jgi:NADH:ubiquinone oxidoreductase subunit 2 (subunit N)
LEFYFNSTEWTFLNLCNFFIKLPKYFYFYFFIFILGFFLKIGLTPFHLYKIEVYKGLPFVTILIYTILFFIVYFLFFSILFLKNISAFYSYYWLSMLLLLLLGVCYIIFLLFDVNFIKSFFAYSTIVNLVSFVCLILANF